MSAPSTVKVAITGGPSIMVSWSPNTNAQQALEAAYNKVNNDTRFTYAIQYYGSSLEMYAPEMNAASTLHAKHAFKIKAARPQ